MHLMEKYRRNFAFHFLSSKLAKRLVTWANSSEFCTIPIFGTSQTSLLITNDKSSWRSIQTDVFKFLVKSMSTVQSVFNSILPKSYDQNFLKDLDPSICKENVHKRTEFSELMMLWLSIDKFVEIIQSIFGKFQKWQFCKKLKLA